MTLSRPRLWSPDTPYLYKLHVYVKDQQGDVVDGYCRRIGIRSIEFRGKEGFWLNGRPYPWPLIGANRHQDFAVVGNALSNSLHWRDARKLRDAGLRVIRNAHYPQDPAFMDACDELGLFVIVNTPGWQFWNDDRVFAERVYSDIRNMVRRDRNHPSVWLWEPILNETWYPEDFAANVVRILHEEYPYPYCYAGCDAAARGAEHFPVQFTHPLNGDDGAFNTRELDPKVCYFTREWGDKCRRLELAQLPQPCGTNSGGTGYAHPGTALCRPPLSFHLLRCTLPYSAPTRRRLFVALVRPPARLSSRSLLWWCDRRIPSTQICLLYVQSPALARKARPSFRNRTDGVHRP